MFYRKPEWKKRQEREAADLRRFTKYEHPGLQQQLDNVTDIKYASTQEKAAADPELADFLDRVCESNCRPSPTEARGRNGTDHADKMADTEGPEIYGSEPVEQRSFDWKANET